MWLGLGVFGIVDVTVAGVVLLVSGCDLNVILKLSLIVGRLEIPLFCAPLVELSEKYYIFKS